MKKGLSRNCIIAMAAVMMLVGCEPGPHFITDRKYRKEVHNDYTSRMTRMGMTDLMLDTLKCAEREAMEFLYAYMPLSDMADYEPQFHLQQVRYAFKAREEMPWGKSVPEDVFRHFVLVYRVNNENLDTARMVMYRELKERVAGMSMEEAALEVNHWCHEHVAYRGSDSRTSAPLATMRTSLGRCGEESTFTVTALRAVGIPARQCYTPRWAHCDDNHAWVEVWIEDTTAGSEPRDKNWIGKTNEGSCRGEWKFMGACEPDPRLNMGWFSVPSTRTMMVHTKAFGKYRGDEEVVNSTSMYSELNLLSHYAPACHVTVTVTNENGRPVEGAQVKFKLYNYAEYYTLSTQLTDNWGQAMLTTGMGDLLIWATDGNQFAYRKLDTRRDSTMTLKLNGLTDFDTLTTLEYEMVPPEAGSPKVVATSVETEANAKRLAYEDSLRNAYTATFPTINNYLRFIKPNPNLTDEQAWDIIRRSEGNYAEIVKFLDNHADENLVVMEYYPGITEHKDGSRTQLSPKTHASLLYEYLCTYSDKDLRDITAATLEAHWTTPANYQSIDSTTYRRGLLPARISNEMVRPYREELARFKGMTAEEIRRWTLDSIKVDNNSNYYNCPVSPTGVYRVRYADSHSRDIFYVAACRAAGVPAYLDNATNTIYCLTPDPSPSGEWKAIRFTNDTTVGQYGTLVLTTPPLPTRNVAGFENPTYWSHFTIAKLENGDLRTFDFENDPRMDKFPATIELEPGTYCLTTGNRYPDGTVHSRMVYFKVAEGGDVTMEIVIPPLVERKQVYGTLDRKTELWEGVELWDYAAKPGMLYINLGNYGEPSKHLVQELIAQQRDIKAWGGMTYMVGPKDVDMVSWNLANTDLSCNKGELEAKLLKAIRVELNNNYPFVVLITGNGDILYHSEGYRIGVVEQALKAAR